MVTLLTTGAVPTDAAEAIEKRTSHCLEHFMAGGK
jgi:hypothetical protein